jgi:hypothetical protein
MKYDDASWHYGGDFPTGQPEEHSGTHIGLFLKWCFMQGWAGEIHLDEEPELVELVCRGEMTGTEFLFKLCDGKLTDEDLSDEGNAFAADYYGDDGYYLEDYEKTFGDPMYRLSEKDVDFLLFTKLLDARKASGNLKKPNADAE